MKTKITGVLIFVLYSTFLYSQNKTINGYIIDNKTGEIIINARISQQNSLISVQSNQYGYFSIILNEIPAELEISAIGYMNKKLIITDTTLQTNNIYLTADEIAIQEIVINAKKEESGDGISKINMNISEISKIPQIFGESDALKAIGLHSGVSQLGEGSSGLYVQGGNYDQNLLVIDEANIYNPSHLFGLISVFNPDVIKNIEIYKGQFPSEFGGRISSVINCQMNDGNKNEHKFKGGIGLLSAHAAIEGPLIKKKLSYILAVRKSIKDIFLNPDKDVSYVPGFYDINFKISGIVNRKNWFFISLYSGKDKIETVKDFNNNWGNNVLNIRWSTNFTQKWFAKFSFIYSIYDNQFNYIHKDKNYNWHTGISDYQFKIDNEFQLNPKISFKWGAGNIYHSFIPGENGFIEQSMFNVNAHELGLYLSGNFNISKKINLYTGMRFSGFLNVGKAEWFVYENDSLTGTEKNNSGVYHSCLYPEPRLKLTFRASDSHQLSVSYAQNTQYYQILQNSIFSYTSLQTWLPVNPNFKPLRGETFTIKYLISFKKTNINLEAFYKNTYNIIDYIDHAIIVNNPYIETQVKQGNGNAKGISIKIEHKSRKFSNMISYTLSETLQKIPGINDDKTYPSLQNIPHDLRILLQYFHNERFSLSGFWILHTGFPVTLPVGYVVSDPYNEQSKIPIYSNRNNGKMPVYHRFDLNVNYLIFSKNKKIKYSINAGIFNLYGRLNPVILDFTGTLGDSENIYVSAFYRAVPYISFNFSF